MRLRTLLIWLAVAPVVAMGAQSTVTANRLLEQAAHLRADVESGERIGVPLYRLMVEMQTERTMTAARWAGSSVSEGAVQKQRAATDRAAAAARHAAGTVSTVSEEADRRLLEVTEGLDDLDAYRERTDGGTGDANSTLAYYSGLIGQMIRFYQDELSQTEDSRITHESRVVVAMFAASEMVSQEAMILAQAGSSRELTTSRFAEFVNTVGAQRYLYDTSIAPYLPEAENDLYLQIVGSDGWQTKIRIENAVLAEHSAGDDGVKLPRTVDDWRAAHVKWGPQLSTLNADRSRGLLAQADARAAELEAEVAWLITGSAGALLVVVVIVVFTTRSVLRRLRRLHERTVTIAEETLPEVVDRLQRGRPVDAEALPRVRGEQDEVGRISDAFARVVAVSVEGHRQLAAERHGFGMFAAGIASRTGNLVSRQLSLTEDLQDSFGHDEALLAQLMRADQLTVGMRRQIENLLILAGGEIPDPHTEPMRIADLLREAAAEVEDFRRIERQALDEISVEAPVISQTSHLLAELLDNATRFSPPRSKVVIRAELVADGLSIEIEDRGPRVTLASYEEMNGRLHSAPPYAVLAENAHRLGLFVVGHLADQLGATVTLRRSVFGGTSAVVILPKELLVPTESEPGPARAPRQPSHEPAAVQPAPAQPVPVQPDRVQSAPAPGGPSDGKAELVLHKGSGLPIRPTHERPQDTAQPVRAAARDGDTRPALPERVPRTHMVEQLREPRHAPESVVVQDESTPEEVADAWADYEQGTQMVEEQLRQDQR
ncbi:nitrate- and nitrite sensing domain-containing protein [Streptomyces sp. NPDC002133]|uniref:sensor histidine kinase n=1 Tax=Streptomyces sp. NPDC002133 TaxID=3154409 RepID=UPI00331A90F0